MNMPAITPRANEEAERGSVRPFDPRTEVSADAKFIVKQLVLWFLVLPIVLGAILWVATH